MASDMPGPDAPYAERIRALRAERGWSTNDLAKRLEHSTIWAIHAWERGDVRRRPGVDSFEDLAQAFGVPADVFPEYRLARARDLLDERQVGLSSALRILGQIEATLAQEDDLFSVLRARGERGSPAGGPVPLRPANGHGAGRPRGGGSPGA